LRLLPSPVATSANEWHLLVPAGKSDY